MKKNNINFTEILLKVVEKAERNGWSSKITIKNINFSAKYIYLEQDPYVKYKRLIHVQLDSTTHTYIGLESVIFSHDFAKAFWGKGYDTYEKEKVPNTLVRYYFQDGDGNDIYSHLESWEYHLQQMVLEKEPLEYLEKFLIKGGRNAH